MNVIPEWRMTSPYFVQSGIIYSIAANVEGRAVDNVSRYAVKVTYR